EVRPRLADGAAHVGDDLDGVEQELLLDGRVLATAGRGHRLEDGLGHLAQVTAAGVDEGQLPLDAEGRALRGCEGDLHQTGSTRRTCWFPPTLVSTTVASASPRRSSCLRSCSGTTAVPRF